MNRAWCSYAFVVGLFGSAIVTTEFVAGGTIRSLNSNQLDQYVGIVYSRCCQPGLRMGCSPTNFRQAGCVSIHQSISCSAAPIKTMDCYSATCKSSSVEEVCEVNIRMAPQNRCKPTGQITTEGCPTDQWQCKIQTYPYTLPDAPAVQVLVCDASVSSICSTGYSVCE